VLEGEQGMGDWIAFASLTATSPPGIVADVIDAVVKRERR
jgi:hypothetical protein